MQLLYEVWLDAGMRTDCVAASELNLQKNCLVTIQFDNYVDYGRVLHCRGEVPQGVDLESLPRIQHRATPSEQSRAHENYVKDKLVHKNACRIVEESKLGMSVVDSHISFDRSKMVLKFTAQGRVDFRQLLRSLGQELKMRIELRQIGSRDVAKMRGGIGTCGRVLCCTSWIHEFQSVNVKMARDQGIATHYQNINGQCGRIKCCMSFEHEGYMMSAQEMPLVGSRCYVDGDEGRILDVNLLKKSTTVRLKQDNRIVNVLRNELDDMKDVVKSSSCSVGGNGSDSHSCGSCS